jgi:hypothetical protein
MLAGMATGAPKPQMASRKAPNPKAMSRAWARRSMVRLVMASCIFCIQPVDLRTL